MKTLISSLHQLSDEELLARVKDLAWREREATTILIAHLAELDARRLYLPEGCSSMFTYCTQVLSFSERAAYARIEAARSARKYPTILDRLVEGSLNLTGIVLLAPHLTPENHWAVLDEAGFKTRRQVEEIVARLRPLPPVAASIRKLAVSKQKDVAGPESENINIALIPPSDGVIVPSASSEPGEKIPSDSEALALNPAPRPDHRAVIIPLAPEYYRLQVTLRSETHARLRQAQELLRHQIPNGDPAEILDRALADLVDKLSRRKFAALRRPR
jgi:hypothetical protein